MLGRSHVDNYYLEVRVFSGLSLYVRAILAKVEAFQETLSLKSNPRSEYFVLVCSAVLY